LSRDKDVAVFIPADNLAAGVSNNIMITYMTRFFLKLTVLLSMIIGFNSSICGQNIFFKCDGIYQTSDNGIKIINKHSESDNRTRDSIIALVNKDGVPRKINNIPDFYLIDTIPIICSNDFKTVKIFQRKGNNKPELSVELNENVKEKFSKATDQNISKPLLIIFENKIIAAPIVVFTIENGKMQITGLDEELMNRIIKKFNK